MRWVPTTLVLVLSCALASAASESYLTLDWSFDTRATNNHVYAVNLNDDPNIEFVADGPVGGLVFGVDCEGQRLWSVNIPGRILDVYAREFADNKNEVLVGSNVRGYSILGGGSYNWNYFPFHDTVAGVYSDDFDNDSRGEAVLVITSPVRGNQILFLDEEGKKGAKVGLRASEFPGAFASTDFDGDGKKELVAGFAVYSVNTISDSLEVGYLRDGSVRAFTSGGVELWSYPTTGGVKVVSVWDLDGDGVDEVLAGARLSVYALKKNGSVLWTYPAGALVNDIKMRDINGDGKAEILVASDRVHVLNASGSRLWATEKIGVVPSVDAADFDSDGKMEVVAATGGVRVLDSEGRELWKSTDLRYVTSVVAVDADNDGFVDVAVGSSDSNLRLFSTKQYVGKKTADRLLKDAQVFYEAGDLVVAKDKAERAKRLYESLPLPESVNKSADLLANISSRSEADSLLSKAREEYAARNLASAIEYANRSKAIYATLGLPKSMVSSDDVIAMALTLPKAEANLSAAKRLYAGGDCLEAHDAAVKAFSLFEWLSDAKGVLEAEDIANKTLPCAVGEEHMINATSYFNDSLYSDALSEIASAKALFDEAGYEKGVERAEKLERSVRFSRLTGSRVFWIELVLIVPLTVLTVILVAAAFLAKRSAAKKAGAHLIKDAGGETPPLGKVKRESMLSGKKRASSLSGKVTPARPFSIKPKDSS